MYNDLYHPCRVLCIKCNGIVIHVGGRRLVQAVCSLTFIISLILAISCTTESAMLAPEMILTVFKDLKPNPPSVRIRYLSGAVCLKIASLAFLLFNVLEFFCYMIIFFEMYRHHKRHVRLCLTNKPKLAKLKKSRNTVTAVGHFTSWVAEILIFGLLQFIISANQESLPLEFEFITWIILRVYRHSINYSVFPMVQCITSKDLRAFVFNFDHFSESCSFVKCSTGQGEDFVPVPNQNNN